MRILAPLAIGLLLSGCLYKTRTVWDLEYYKRYVSILFGKTMEDNFKQIQLAVNQGLITPQQAEIGFRAKWEAGAEHSQVQGWINKIVDQNKKQKAEMAKSKGSAPQTASF